VLFGQLAGLDGFSFVVSVLVIATTLFLPLATGHRITQRPERWLTFAVGVGVYFVFPSFAQNTAFLFHRLAVFLIPLWLLMWEPAERPSRVFGPTVLAVLALWCTVNLVRFASFSREAADFAARHRIGYGVSYGPFEVMAKATRYYREQCGRHGWEPTPDQIIYRANMAVADTDDEAHALVRAQPKEAPFTMRAAVRDAVSRLDARNIAGEARPAVVSGALPTTFIGSPDTVVEQVRQCREVVGAGVLDLSLHPPGSMDLDPLTRALELFGTKVLPRIREI